MSRLRMPQQAMYGNVTALASQYAIPTLLEGFQEFVTSYELEDNFTIRKLI